MSSQDDDDAVGVGGSQRNEEDSQVKGEEPLMVAMQPTAQVEEVPQEGDPSMIEVQEVVVVSEDIEGGGLDLKTAVDISSGNLVPVGAVEEIEEIVNATKYHHHHHHHIKEPVGPSKRRPSVSSSEQSGTEESESDTLEYAVKSHREPKKRSFAHRLQWRSRDMLDAMKAVETKKMTIRGAAKKFCVPYSTLKDRVHGRVRHGTKPGVKTILSPEEEEELVRYIKDMEAAGFQMRHVDVRDRAGELLRLNHGHNTPYKEGSPGHNWLGGFLKRHPGLEFKRTLQRNLIPSAAKQKQMLKKFYEIASQIFKKHRLHHKSDRIFVVSEFRIRLTQHATLLVAASADGVVLPPFVVFHGQKLKLSSARQVYPEAFFTCSFNGFINDDIFLWWFRDHFLKKIPYAGNRPLVLFLSRSVTDISLQLAQRAKEERVYLVAIPPQVTHLVSPLDEELSLEMEDKMTKKANKWHQQNENYPFTQKAFAEILRKVWNKGLMAEEVTRKFSQNGLFPLSSTAISADRILNATQSLREAQQRAASAVSVKQDPLAGLSLLSALSSHEYASLGHMYTDQLNRSFDGDDAENSESPERSGKRRRSDDEEDDRPAVKMKLEEESPLRSSSKFKVSEELVKHVLEPTPPARKTRASQPPPAQTGSVQSEIVAARENIEQINRAIDSILEKAAQDEALKKKQQQKGRSSRAEPVQALRSDADAAEHLLETVKAEHGLYRENVVSEEIVPQELVQQDLVEEQIVEEQIVESNTIPLSQEEAHPEAYTPPPAAEEVPETQAEVEVSPSVSSPRATKTDITKLVQNKRTILVETLMVNGQKVKIVRMAPPGDAPRRTISIPSLRGKQGIKSSRLTIVRAPAPPPPEEVVLPTSSYETGIPESIYQPQEQVVEEVVEQPAEMHVLPDGEFQHQQHLVEEEVQPQEEIQDGGDGILVGGEGMQVVVSQPHLITQESVPAQIFDESVQLQEVDPEQQQHVIKMESGEEMVVHRVDPTQHVIQQDENGVQYVQVYDPNTGQHQQVILEQQIV